MTSPDAGSPDPAFWRAALDRVTERIREERGVRDDVDVSRIGAGSLLVRYGGLELRVGTTDALAVDEASLFEQVDEWVAFDRPDGPGRLLERDRDRVERYRADLLVQRDRYDTAARLVFDDVATTTAVDAWWSVVVRDRTREARWWDTGSAAGPVDDVLPDPQLTLNCAVGEFDLHDDADSDLVAVVNLIDAVQDALIEEVHGAWPPCPTHRHPLVVDDGPDGIAVWACPSGAVIAPVGQLGGEFR